MAWRCSRATSRYAKRLKNLKNTLLYILLSYICSFPLATEAGLYTMSDQILILTPDTVESVVFNSTGAVVVEFYATWCGHCVAFSPVWKRLAIDTKEWKPAVDLAAIDCSEEKNMQVCRRFSITGYPSLKFFPAFSDRKSKGQDLRGFPRDVPELRHLIIDKLEKHSEPWPPACPPLEPVSVAEVDAYTENKNVQHLALVFETANSYVGRELTLDMLQFDNIAVRRVLQSETELVDRLNVTQFPSCYLYTSPSNFSRLSVLSEARTFYSYALQRLPGVVRTGKPLPAITDIVRNGTEELWRPFDRTRVYMSDLESALHYSLRVELSAHPSISGNALTALRQYVSILAKHFPGRPAVKRALQAVDIWLQKQKETTISYSDFRAVLDSTVQSGDAVLPEVIRWVGCQGSRQHYRGYPCAVWTLFHVLTVQAEATGSSDPRAVLQAMRGYVSSFFGCRPCADHFEHMAQDLHSVTTLSAAVIWLWSRHNHVNIRLAGALNEDPHFPKIKWPSPELCSACHGLSHNRDHVFEETKVLHFLQNYYSAQHILPDYLQDEDAAVAQQRATLSAAEQYAERRRARNAPATPPAPDDEEEEEEEEDTTLTAEEEESEGVGGAIQEGEPYPAAAQAPPSERPARMRGWAPHRPSIVGLKLRQPPEDIVDLDSFVSQHYRAKPGRAGHRPPDPQRQDPAGQPRGRVKRDLNLDVGGGGELALQLFPQPQGRHWLSVFSMGFSRLDVSLCVLLYLLSCLCLLTMWLCVRTHHRSRRTKAALP